MISFPPPYIIEGNFLSPKERRLRRVGASTTQAVQAPQNKRSVKCVRVQGAMVSRVELEAKADQLLAAAGGDTLYPYTTEAWLDRKIRRENAFPFQFEGTTSFSSSELEEASDALFWASRSSLTELEWGILHLMVDGYTQAEIADELRFSRRQMIRKIEHLRWKVRDLVTPAVLRSLHEVEVYHAPAKHCVVGREACRRSGYCPYGRS